ncbi:TlpA family protein disulfide reductase [Nitriliruptoraceae bacterium ZYF776]|nr:TlpA family protein disulfide reductase [Profundirhabdus halotolerans]
MRRGAIAAIVIAILVAAAFGTRFGTDPGLVDSPLIGREAPDVTLPYLEREGEVALRDLRGEVVVVNFWASWCVPCREEHPALVAAAERYEDDGVRFLGVLYQDQREPASTFLDELGRGYDYLEDPNSATAIEFGVFGLPETYVIDRDGRIAAKITGATTFDRLAGTIDDVLAGRPPGSVSGGGSYESGVEGSGS